jgi:tight adherence protein C
MNPIQILLLLGVMIVGVAASFFVIMREMARGDNLGRRLTMISTGEQAVIAEAKEEGALFLRLVTRLGMMVARSGLLSRKTIGEMTATLEGIGFRGGRGLGLFVGAKLLLFFVTPLVVFLLVRAIHVRPVFGYLFIIASAVIGMLAPEFFARRVRKKYLAKVESGVADALDMLVICADAGLALESALVRVAGELRGMNAPLADELTQTSRELQMSADMRSALQNLGDRTGIEVLKRLATTLIQSLQYGTPLTQAMRSLSAEMRQEALIKFEERAAKLPVLLTIPMILFNLPCLFMIMAGPAIINVLKTIHNM